MPLAIEVRFEAAFSDAVRATWERLEHAGLPSMGVYEHGHHEPHMTLLLAEHIRTEDLPAIAKVRWETLRPSFSSVGLFPGSMVLFLGAVPDLHLITAHRELHRLLKHHDLKPWPNYTPQNWVPHCTLGVGIPSKRLPDAIEIVAPLTLMQTSVSAISLTDRYGATTPIWNAHS